jgi:pilus assembly protein CpaF
MQEIFKYTQLGVDDRGRVMGRFGPTGIRPRSSDIFKSHGFDLESSIFSEGGSGA